jgi:hypothetical protein
MKLVQNSKFREIGVSRLDQQLSSAVSGDGFCAGCRATIMVLKRGSYQGFAADQ